MRMFKKLSEIKSGSGGTIRSFDNHELSVKLMEMGCVPGEEVEVLRVAPLGDPIAIGVAGYTLSMRKDEACFVKVLPV